MPDRALDAERVSAPSLPPVALPPDRGLTWKALAALAAVTGAAAVGLGAWALVASRDDSSSAASANAGFERAVAIVASPGVETIPFVGSVGRIVLVVGERGQAVLKLNGLGPAASGTDYQAWITLPGSAEFLPAAVFDGTAQFVALSRPVTVGARVSVTLEDEGGATEPSRIPQLTAIRT